MSGSSATGRRKARAPTPCGPPGDVEPRGGLHGVGVQHGAWSSPAHQTRHLGKGLHRAHLVVDQLDRHNADGPVERCAKGFQVDNAVISHLDHSNGGTEEALRPLGRVQYRVVLDRA
jgi:hypothetical protein